MNVRDGPGLAYRCGALQGSFQNNLLPLLQRGYRYLEEYGWFISSMVSPKPVGIIPFSATAGPRDTDEGEEAQAQQDGQILKRPISATTWNPGERKVAV